MNVQTLVELIRAITEDVLRDSYLRRGKGLEMWPAEHPRPADPELRRLIAELAGARRQRISPTFKLVFLTAVLLTLASAAGAAVIAFGGPEPLTANQQKIFDALNAAWKMGLGAIFGLLGGKAT